MGSPLFDEAYYRSHTKRKMGDISPAMHYIKYGRRDEVDPSAFFSNKFYIQAKGLRDAKRACPLLLYERDRILGFSMGSEDFSHEEYKRQSINGNDIGMAKELELKGKTILLVSHELSRSGAPIVLLDLAKRLKSMGFVPMFMSPIHGPMEEDIAAAGIACKVSYLVSLDGDVATEEQRSLKDFVATFRLVILNTLVSVNWVKAFKTQNSKVMLWAHDGKPMLRLLGKKGKKKAIQSLKLFDRVLCGGEYAASIVRQITGGIINPEILLYGVPDYSKSVFCNSATKRDKIRCVIAGSIEIRKGQHILIDALSQLTSDELNAIDVVCVGRTLSKDIEAKIDNCGLACVRRERELAFGELLRLIAESDVLLCPSLDDPMPSVATIAMLFSKVVLVSDHTGTASLIKDGESGFIVKANNRAALTAAIRRLISNKGLYQKIGECARAIYEENFTIDAFDRNIQKLICNE